MNCEVSIRSGFFLFNVLLFILNFNLIKDISFII